MPQSHMGMILTLVVAAAALGAGLMNQSNSTQSSPDHTPTTVRAWVDEPGCGIYDVKFILLGDAVLQRSIGLDTSPRIASLGTPPLLHPLPSIDVCFLIIGVYSKNEWIQENDSSLLWGHYSPMTYFGLRTRTYVRVNVLVLFVILFRSIRWPAKAAVGAMWIGQDKTKQTHLRHECHEV